jgi:glycosyltransferase involved in cell wall biosynthesis
MPARTDNMMSSLVSVVVVSYNSSAYVTETLDSIYNQSWRDIELIITDDCSSDNTVELCSDWIARNSHRFVNTKLIASDKNGGVSANANRGLNLAKGIWIKFFAADDSMKPNCIAENMAWVSSNPEARVLFSKIDIYRNTFDPQNLIETAPQDIYNDDSIMAPGRSAESQHKMLLICDRIHFTPSAFLHKETLLSVGGFDERFRILEDYPLWLNLTKNGHKLNFLDAVTVNYRRHIDAINNTGVDYLVNPNYFKAEGFRRIYTYPFLPWDIRLDQRYCWLVLHLFHIRIINRNNKPNRFLYALLKVYLNPFRYLIYLKKAIYRNLEDKEFYR